VVCLLTGTVQGVTPTDCSIPFLFKTFTSAPEGVDLNVIVSFVPLNMVAQLEVNKTNAHIKIEFFIVLSY
jgi:hypothetical protein